MYLLCEKDKGLPLAVQEQMVRTLGEGVTQYRCDASHSPFLSVPEKVVEAMEIAARFGAEKSGAGVGLPNW